MGSTTGSGEIESAGFAWRDAGGGQTGGRLITGPTVPMWKKISANRSTPPMDSSSIDLPGSRVESIRVEGERVTVRFAPAYITKTLSGSTERTRWRQEGALVFEGAEMIQEPPECPAVCAGGDVGENVYTYRDMIPIPLESRGRAHCNLRFEGTDRRLVLHGEAVRLEMEDRPHYIEHIRGA
jgi:hypothetical protein